MKRSSWLSLGLSLAALLGCAVVAADGRGLEIATQVDQRDTGFGDFTADLTMTLFSSRGETNTRRMRARIDRKSVV